MRTYIVHTLTGDVRVQATTQWEAERKVRVSGKAVSGSREEGFGSYDPSPLGIVDFNDGDVNIPLGGGLTIDSGGDLGLNVGGLDIDLT